MSLLRRMRREANRAKYSPVHVPPTEIWRSGEDTYVAIETYRESEGCPVCGRQVRIHPHYKGYDDAPFTVYRLCNQTAGRIE